MAAQSPQAPELERLVEERQQLDAKLRQRIEYIGAIWSEKGLKWRGEQPSVTVAAGCPRFVVVDLSNETPGAINLISLSPSQTEPTNSMTVLPGKSQPFLIEIKPGEPEVELSFRAGDDARRLRVGVVTNQAATLRGKLVDGDIQLPTVGRVRVEGSDRLLRRAGPFAANRSFTEKPILELTAQRMAAVPFFYADGSFEITVPPGKTKVSLERGFEHAIVSQTVELQPGETREVTLTSRRFLDSKARSWISGDTHIHWVTNAWNVDLPLHDLALVQQAEDLRVANNLTLLHRTTTDAFIKPSQAPVGPVARFSDGDYHIEMAEEYRNQNLYGHLCFLNLQWLVLPIGTGPQIAGDDSLDYPLNKTAILEAREQGAISIEAHGTGANHELPLNAVHGLTDSVDQLDPEDYYRLLDSGFQLPLTNGSDHPARIAGCARAYVQIDGQFDYEKWIDGIRRGRTFTTSGPLLFLTVDDAGPGTVLTPSPNQPAKAKLQAYSRFPLGRVQIVSNGEVLKEIETSEREVALECDVPIDQSRWVVARSSRNEHWNALWHPDVAHTSAIYIHRDGRSVFRPEAASEWIDRMRLHQRDILAKGIFANSKQRTEATAYVDESIRRYQRLISQQRQPRGELPWEAARDRLLMQAGFASHLGHDVEFVKQVREATHHGQLKMASEPLTLLRVHINPESRVKLALVTPPERVVQHRTQRFLVEVHNEARIQAPLRIRAIDQSQPTAGAPSWFDVRLVENLLSSSLLTGDETEWKLLEIRCSEAGHREVRLEADAGQGTQDLGFRATIDLLLKCVPRRTSP
ncbi:MAG: CehA/McbA family metallohydrolase [Pirellulales bacterium]